MLERFTRGNIVHVYLWTHKRPMQEIPRPVDQFLYKSTEDALEAGAEHVYIQLYANRESALFQFSLMHI